VSAAVPTLNRASLTRRLFQSVAMIREFEQVAGKAFARNEIPGFIHLSIGQEGVAVGVCAALDERDKITSTHRGHGHVLARGSDPNRVMAEIYGRETGLCKGRGGTMHLYDFARGVLGTNGIVAAGGPLACGAALAERNAGSGGVVVCFMGDGATDQGSTHEAMNMAAVWALPVIFVVENNGFSEGTPLASHSSAEAIVDRAAAYSFPGVRVDGQDALAVFEAAKQAVTRARAGAGPSLIEAVTSRFRGHFEGDAMRYTRSGPDAEAAARDPLDVLRSVLENEFTADEIEQDLAKAKEIVATAQEFARNSPRPSADSVLEGVFTNPQHSESA